MSSYASFGTPSLSPDVIAFCDDCFQAGYEWGQQGNKKLPRRATVLHRQVPVVGSRHEWAHAFIDGWKMARQNAQEA